jgi:DNA repair exonuclease SbcCD ATPase subunit
LVLREAHLRAPRRETSRRSEEKSKERSEIKQYKPKTRRTYFQLSFFLPYLYIDIAAFICHFGLISAPFLKNRKKKKEKDQPIMTSVMTPRTDTLSTVHDMSIDELRREYTSLKSTGYSLSVEETHLKDRIEVLREESVRAELNAEMKEEQMSNQLFRRLDGAEKEVQRYKAMLREEENEVEALTARIKKMRNEKNEVENVLEERQEYLLMNLQRKLLETARKKTSVEQELMLERQRYLDVLVTRLDALRSRSTAGSAESSTVLRPPSATPAGASSPAGDNVSVAASTEKAAAATPASTTSVGDASFSLTTGNPPSASTPEKAASRDDIPPTVSLKSASFSSLTRGSVKDVPLAGTPHATTLAPGRRPSVSGTPHPSDLSPMVSHSSETHQAVVALERKLNSLLLEQAAAMQRTSATEKQCAELGAKLRSVQEATFLDRARAAKLKEDLKEARARLAEVNSSFSATAVSTMGDLSFDDNLSISFNPRSGDLSFPLAMSNLSLRERTRELLSSIPPAPTEK